MYRTKLLQRGDLVQIINEENPLYGEVGEISAILMNGSYRVRTVGGMEMLVGPQDCVPCLRSEEFRELYKAHLYQLQLLAVDIGDKQWFEEISRRLSHTE